jgi:hypothetical protein
MELMFRGESNVKKSLLGFSLAMVLLVAAAGTALATPSSQIWIPSTDVLPFKTVRLEFDNYFRASGEKNSNNPGARDPNSFDIGVTVGVLPFKALQMEAGFDFLTIANDPNDQHPWSGNIKLATPEDSMCQFSPALAVGLYNARPVKDIATRDAPSVTSGQNIVYGLVAKTVPPLGPLPSLGRFSAGYYRGAKRALVDNPDPALAKPANDGVLASWDRTMSEISDKLWFGVDYQGGGNVDSSFNFGFSWNFTKNIALVAGYDIYDKKNQAGSNTITTQINITMP